MREYLPLKGAQVVTAARQTSFNRTRAICISGNLRPCRNADHARTQRYLSPAYMIKLTKECEIATFACVHPDDDDRRWGSGARASSPTEARSYDRRGDEFPVL